MARIPSDPLFSTQWHLQNATAGLLDLNVVDVWDDYTGTGVDVAVIDDGVQHTHPDLDGNYSTSKDWDFQDNDSDASGVNNGDNHGTAVAGIIGANANNESGGVGVAYGSTLFGFRGLSFVNLVNAINHASGLSSVDGLDHTADIVNMSLGSGSRVFFDIHPAGRLSLGSLNQAINDAVVFGRNRLGTILVKSAGNARRVNQDTNASSWNANPHTISVAAVDQDGFVSSYSTPGASVLVSAFGTPGQVVTTDRTGRSGYALGDYTNSFNGTSAAAPMVSGVVALMLEANPLLGWRDVQEILAYSARHVGSDVGGSISGREEYAWSFNGATNWNGGGLHFSNDYGFGLVDAKSAVRLAETWLGTPQTSANDVSVSKDFLNTSGTVGFGGATFRQAVTNNIDIEHVEVDVSFLQWYDLGDLSMRLISPDGTSSILINNSGENNGSAAGGFGSGRWKFYSNAFRGEETAGTWTVELVDIDSSNVSPITIDDINITFHGREASQDDTFIFTEEYSDYAGLFGHTRVFDGGRGIDTINAAAVDTATFINLETGYGFTDGVSIRVSNIENVFTGDGNDYLIGNAANNQLLGMRGGDNLYGRGGNDVLLGGAGNDWVDGGLGNDYLNGTNHFAQGAGERDTLVSGSLDDRDIFVLGERQNGAGRVFYNDQRGADFALIQDFDVYDFVGDVADKIQLVGSAAAYSISNVRVGSFAGAGISFANDLIGIVEGVSASSLNLANSNQFTYV